MVSSRSWKITLSRQRRLRQSSPRYRLLCPLHRLEVSTKVLSEAFLGVVSEKTGYPVETLELDMDMEADLGIDSIKRVEILGAVRTLFPELPKVEPEAFAELRTLRQVIDHLNSSFPKAEAPAEARLKPRQFHRPQSKRR